jgi:hypothetical protein
MWPAVIARGGAADGNQLLRSAVRSYARKRGGAAAAGKAPTAAAAASDASPPEQQQPQQHDRPPTVAANAIAAAAAARARAAEAALSAAAARAGAAASGPSSTTPSFDASAAGAAPRVHRLIGDPRTGVADDTTLPCPSNAAGNDVSVELLWTQENPGGGVEWHRYTPFGRQQPHMRRDARLSDHSRNLMYVLRCADPQVWTVEALARKFRVRRQRVLAVLALKELEAQALEEGRLMGGGGAGGAGSGGAASSSSPLIPLTPDNSTTAASSPGLARGLRAYCMTVDLADVRLQAGSREPFDLADGAGAAAGGSGGKARRTSSKQPLDDQQQQSSWQWARGGDLRRAASGKPALGADPAADLRLVAPAQAATAQRLHSALLSMLQQHGYSADRLLVSLLEQVDAAEAHFDARVRGTPVERALELGWRAAEAEREAARLEAEAALEARRAEADPWGLAAAGGESGAAEDSAGEQKPKEGEGGEAEASGSSDAALPTPFLFDFEGQRTALRAAVDALRPLLSNAGPRAEREAAVLAAELSALLGAASEGSDANADADAPLRVAAAAAAPDVLARAFNAMPRDQRQALLDRAPSACAALDLRAADLTAVVSPYSSNGAAAAAGAGAASTPGYTALASSDDDGAGASSSSSYALGRWPGQVRPLVDVWGYEEVGSSSGAAPPADPDALFGALLLGALPPLERAVAVVDRCAAFLGIGSASSESSAADALGSLDDFLAGGGKKEASATPSPSSATPLPTCADVLALREDAYTYQHIDWIYNRAVDHQAAEIVAAAAAERAQVGLSGGGQAQPAAVQWAAARLMASPPRRVSETPGAWDTPPLPPAQQQRMLRILRALDPAAAERLMYVEALAREDRAAGAARGGAAADAAARRAARTRDRVSRVLSHMDAQMRGGGGEQAADDDAAAAEAGGDGGENNDEKQQQPSSSSSPLPVALPPRRPDLPADAPSTDRAPLELVSAFVEAAVVGRQFHRGSGERHVAQVPTFPSFDGRPLDEASAEGAESELSALAREAARREDSSMWRDFRARLLHNLGVSGPDLWDVRGRARPQRPAEGWSIVVHPVGGKKEEAGVTAAAGPAAATGGAPYVAEPGGALRPLRGDEVAYEKRRMPKRRRRWPL